MADLDEFATLDFERADRRGYPEAVLCEGKSAEQVAPIAAAFHDRANGVVLFTRASPAHAEAVLVELPDALPDMDSRLIAWPADPPSATGGLVVVVSPGTFRPIGRPGGPAARYLGRSTELLVDVGVAALLAMLNSCSPGVGVVKIDNGYGASHLAAQIAAPGSPG